MKYWTPSCGAAIPEQSDNGTLPYSVAMLSLVRQRVPLWYGIVAGAAPGVAAQQAADGKVETLEGAVLEDGLSGVFATGGGETTRRS